MSPSKYRLRRVFRGVVQNIARPFIHFQIHPTVVTYLSLLFSIIAALVLLVFQNALWYALFVFLTGLFDGVDGAVARGTGKASTRGAFVDSIADKVAEITILIPIGIIYETTEVLSIPMSIWTMICALSWILISYSRARAESLGISDLDVGLGARSERLFILVVFAALNMLVIGLIAVTVVGVSTVAFRYYHYSSLLSEGSTKSKN